MYDRWAGRLTEDEEGYHFQYRSEYLGEDNAEAVSLTLPLRKEEFHSTILFPFLMV